MEDLRPVQLVTTVPPRVGERMRFVKLHRSKACPTPFLPQPLHPRRSSPHSAPSQTDADAQYSRFMYIDPVLYLEMLSNNLHELEKMECYGAVDVMCKQSAMEMLHKQLQSAMDEELEELELMERFASPNAGMYQQHPKQLLRSSYVMAVNQPSVLDRSGIDVLHSVISEGNEPYNEEWIDNDQYHDYQHDHHYEDGQEYSYNEGEGEVAASVSPSTGRRYRGYSMGSEYSSHSRARSDSVASHTESDSVRSHQHGASGATIDASMFQDEDEAVFYQAEDGQLCFLSGFNMSCLQADYSATLKEFDSHAEGTVVGHKRLPLPDYVEGTIVDVKQVHYTRDLQQRMRFLSHLALFCDIRFVEITLGYALSHETKKAFKKDFIKRKVDREKKAKAEKRADARQQRQEETRINDLKARMQRIDPNDEFFAVHPVTSSLDDAIPLQGEEFGPSLLSESYSSVNGHAAQRYAEPCISFSEICRASTDPVMQNDRNFPVLGSSPPVRSSFVSSQSKPQSQSWGPAKKAATTTAAASASSSQPKLSSSPPRSTKKGKKGKKVVLFSTSAHRGGVY
jgi:hypothetical protein